MVDPWIGSDLWSCCAPLNGQADLPTLIPVDSFGTVLGWNPTPYGILALWAVNGLSIVYWVLLQQHYIDLSTDIGTKWCFFSVYPTPNGALNSHFLNYFDLHNVFNGAELYSLSSEGPALANNNILKCTQCLTLKGTLEVYWDPRGMKLSFFFKMLCM